MVRAESRRLDGQRAPEEVVCEVEVVNAPVERNGTRLRAGGAYPANDQRPRAGRQGGQTRIEAFDETDCKEAPGLRCGGDQETRLARRLCRGLFHQAMEAADEEGARRRRQRRDRGGHERDVRTEGPRHVFDRPESKRARGRRREPPGPVEIGVHHGAESDVRAGRQLRRMECPESTGTDHDHAMSPGSGRGDGRGRTDRAGQIEGDGHRHARLVPKATTRRHGRRCVHLVAPEGSVGA